MPRRLILNIYFSLFSSHSNVLHMCSKCMCVRGKQRRSLGGGSLGSDHIIIFFFFYLSVWAFRLPWLSSARMMPELRENTAVKVSHCLVIVSVSSVGHMPCPIK